MNDSGQLGDGTTVDRLTPVTVTGLTGATAITTGWIHMCTVMSDGQVKCWAYSYDGQLGDGTTTDRATPVTVLS
jgi:alpha-tubulin suppressor-like RCC1 family protein